MTFISVERPTINQCLIANVSSSHAVSQLVLVPDNRHEAHVSLDLDVLIQDQDAVGLSRNRPQGVDSLCCILQLLTKVVNLWTRGGRIRNLSECSLPPRILSDLSAFFG